VRIVAICGTASSSRPEIMVQPPEVELWGLNTSFAWMPRWERWFEMHDRRRRSEYITDEYLAWLRNASAPIYMLDTYPDIPQSLAYPVEDVTEGGRFHKRFDSSIAYMLALAVHERVDEIRILGVDMSQGSEFAYQREGMAYWRGVAEGLGIKVYIPQVSPLNQEVFYGRDPEWYDARRMLTDQIDRLTYQLDKEVNTFVDELDAGVRALRLQAAGIAGAIQSAKRMLAEGGLHGADSSDNPGT
jgi:hypothetical protein